MTAAPALPTPTAAPAFDPLDWALAEKVARRVAGREPLAASYLAESLRDDFRLLTAQAEALVGEHTGRRPRHERWSSTAHRVGQRSVDAAPLRRSRPGWVSAWPRAAAPIGAGAGTETGVFRYLARGSGGTTSSCSTRTTRTPMPYYVGSNILASRSIFRPRDAGSGSRSMSAPTAVHRRAVAEAYLSLVGASLADRSRSAAARAALGGQEMREGRNLDDGGLVALLAARSSAVPASVQALMSLLEGHGNGVMNRLEYVSGQARIQIAAVAASEHQCDASVPQDRRARVEDAPSRSGKRSSPRSRSASGKVPSTAWQVPVAYLR
jgi:hypothetical protein